MSEEEFQYDLLGILEDAYETGREADVRTFEDEMVLTMNKGLVVSFPNGDEFQLTIVQSGRGEEEE